jgi:hypothetical protein
MTPAKLMKESLEIQSSVNKKMKEIFRVEIKL